MLTHRYFIFAKILFEYWENEHFFLKISLLDTRRVLTKMGHMETPESEADRGSNPASVVGGRGTPAHLCAHLAGRL